MQYSCLIFGEGGKDYKFLLCLIDLEKFKYHTNKWFFTPDHASGSSPEVILGQCRKAMFGEQYDLVLCFIDLDKLKSDYPVTWEKEKEEMESRYSNITVIWQIDNAEDEYKKVLGGQYRNKHELNQAAKQESEKFINSDFWKKILKSIKDKEEEFKTNLQNTEKLP